MERKAILFIFLIFSLLLSGCGSGKETVNNPGTADVLKIYTTVYPLKDFSEKIGGKYVEVETVYPPGTDEHSYEPTQKDIIEMANGHFFFYIGYGLEGFVQKVGPILENEGVKVVAVGEKVHIDDSRQVNHDDHHHGNIDPHIWIDPLYAKELARHIKNELAEAKPEQKKYFEKNYESLAKQLDEFHNRLTSVAKNAKVKKFVVSHAAYGYWEKRYGLEQIHISGISTSQEPSQKKLTQVMNEVEKGNFKYILTEQNISNKLVDVVRRETDTSVLTIHNLAVLTERDIKNNEDYLSIMKKNIDTLEKALNQ